MGKVESMQGDFAGRLRLIRVSKGITIREMAELLDISERTERSYENRDRGPTTNAAMRIAETLGVPFMWLMGFGPTFSWEVAETPQ